LPSFTAGCATIDAADSTDAMLRETMQAMLRPDGVAQRTRSWHLNRHESCFVGREAVDWLVRQQGISREAARQLGRRMLARGWLRHVLHEHDFEDAHLFYRGVTHAEQSAESVPLPAGLAAALAGPQGPLRPACRRGVALHRRCATGRELVHWISAQHSVDARQASAWAHQLMRSGRLRHVFDDRPFSASRELYRVV
jgi:Domain found in Dishevelled, Egl-10, and Pleckstrin (DEP)